MNNSPQSLSFEKFMAKALYGKSGYYKSNSQKSARRGDYITSPEVGPLFGAVLARTLDSFWQQAGCPEELFVFEAGAGSGTLARSILHAEPACLPSLKYVLVEQSEYLISQQSDLLERQDCKIQSLKVDFNGAIPHPPVDFGVVIANELLDNLPIALLKKTADSWAEVAVDVDEKGSVLSEKLIKPSKHYLKLANHFAPNAKTGQIIPVQNCAMEWIKKVASVLGKGRVLLFDYGVLTTAELCARPLQEWLRTYWNHFQGVSPYESVGEQDITCEIAIDQLKFALSVEPEPVWPVSVKSQKDFLKSWDLTQLVNTTSRHRWFVPSYQMSYQMPMDLPEIEFRSRASEALALTDSPGLGDHWVMEVSID